MRLLATLLAAGLMTLDPFAEAGHGGAPQQSMASLLPEHTPPSVAITAPTAGGGIGGWAVMVSADASDDSGVSHVEFFVDGTSLGAVSSSPYEVAWDTQNVASGTHTLTAVATDSYGNVATSSPVSVVVDHAPPSVSFSSPTSGATVGGVVPLRVNATDDAVIVRVDYLLDGTWGMTTTTAPFGVDWDSGVVPDGSHTLTVTAYDAVYSSATSTITVNTLQPVSAEYDPTFKVPMCATLAPFCDTTNRVRGQERFEPHAPNTIHSSCADGSVPYPGHEINRIKVSTLSGAPLGTGERVRIDVYVTSQIQANDYLDLFVASDATQPSWTLLTTMTPGNEGKTVFSAEYVLPAGPLQAVRAQSRFNSVLSPCSDGAYNDHDDVVFAVDSGPSVTLTAPANNAHLTGTVSLSATTVFYHPVTKVEFYDGTTLLGTRSSEPYSLSWNTLSVADGAHTLTAKVYDAAGRDATSAGVAVTVDNTPPNVALTSPTQGMFIRGEVELDATATDNVSVIVPRIEFYDGATLLGGSTFGVPWWKWNTQSVSDGAHTLTVKAYDDVGNVRTSTAVGVTVDNTVPTATLVSPSQSTRQVRGVLQLSATANDNLGVTRVEFYMDYDHLIGTDTSAPYAMSWNSASLPDGYHAFSVRAYDAAGNVGFSYTAVVTVDNTPPTTALTSPMQGAVLRGNVVLSASASDSEGITQLAFYDGSALIDTAFGGRTSVAWNTAGATDGAHTLTVRAYDSTGNVATSTAVGVSVDNTAPTTALSAPAQGGSLKGTVQVSATASDNQAVTRVEFYAGTTLLGTDTTSPYSVSWDTTSGADGAVTLITRAYDAAGNVTVSASRAVTVDNTAPTVALTSPANGASLSALSLSTTIQASASDAGGVTQVVFYDGATVLGTDTSAPYSVSWNLLSASKGAHTLTARASDAAGNVTSSAPITVTVK